LKDNPTKLTPNVKNLINNTVINENFYKMTNLASFETDEVFEFKNVLLATECRIELDSKHFNIDNALMLFISKGSFTKSD